MNSTADPDRQKHSSLMLVRVHARKGHTSSASVPYPFRISALPFPKRSTDCRRHDRWPSEAGCTMGRASRGIRARVGFIINKFAWKIAISASSLALGRNGGVTLVNKLSYRVTLKWAPHCSAANTCWGAGLPACSPARHRCNLGFSCCSRFQGSLLGWASIVRQGRAETTGQTSRQSLWTSSQSEAQSVLFLIENRSDSWALFCLNPASSIVSTSLFVPKYFESDVSVRRNRKR